MSPFGGRVGASACPFGTRRPWEQQGRLCLGSVEGAPGLEQRWAGGGRALLSAGLTLGERHPARTGPWVLAVCCSGVSLLSWGSSHASGLPPGCFQVNPGGHQGCQFHVFPQKMSRKCPTLYLRIFSSTLEDSAVSTG